MTRTTTAAALKAGDVLALPMGRTATVLSKPIVGRTYVTFRTEHGKSRLFGNDEVMLEDRPTCQWFARCENPSDGTMPHPVLGDVPCCTRCADHVGALDMLVKH